jgi:acetamidase/formamidase
MAMHKIEARREALHGALSRGHQALASVAVDFRVAQVVNGAKGVHAVLPHGSIR